jgi:hypothetical protein
MSPKELLQIIHNRGEQAAVPAAIHDQARQAAQELVKWIDEQVFALKPQSVVPNEKQ